MSAFMMSNFPIYLGLVENLLYRKWFVMDTYKRVVLVRPQVPMSLLPLVVKVQVPLPLFVITRKVSITVKG